MKWVLTTVVIMFAVWPDVAAACPGCTATSEESRIAFLITTGILTFLPLSLIGGVVFWLRRRTRQLEVEANHA